ncbi:hypothetical protein BH18ACT8_BH18ACT8_18180 [soil metagenome]
MYGSSRWSVLSGTALLTGMALIAVKSLAILITGDQPPLLFEISPFFFGLGVLLLARALDLTGSRKRVVPALGLISLLAGAMAAMTEVTGEVSGPAIATAALAAIVGAVVSGWHPGGDRRKRALMQVGLVVVPAMFLGGILSEINERLLEIGLLAYAAAWGLAGLRLVRWSQPAGSDSGRASSPAQEASGANWFNRRAGSPPPPDE